MCLDISCSPTWSPLHLCATLGVIHKAGESFSGSSGDKSMASVQFTERRNVGIEISNKKNAQLKKLSTVCTQSNTSNDVHLGHPNPSRSSRDAILDTEQHVVLLRSDVGTGRACYDGGPTSSRPNWSYNCQLDGPLPLRKWVSWVRSTQDVNLKASGPSSDIECNSKRRLVFYHSWNSSDLGTDIVEAAQVEN